MPIQKRAAAEFLGTFWLIFAGCGAAVLAGKLIGFLGIALAFGLALTTMAYAIGHISGCHINPAVSLGLYAAKRFPAKDLAPYIVAQVLGAVAGAFVVWLIATRNGRFDPTIQGFAANYYGSDYTLGNYSLWGGLAAEMTLTFFFVFVILGATDKRAPVGFAPLAIGLTLAVAHLPGIVVTNLSLNPARSTAAAIFARGVALQQLWAFWLAPIVGGLVAGIVYPWLAREEEKTTVRPAP
ncbi:MAG: aquaporin Z [Planctomycetes bacterium]|nr:aquaporin Z [Planctomycetota bacterium]